MLAKAVRGVSSLLLALYPLAVWAAVFAAGSQGGLLVLLVFGIAIPVQVACGLGARYWASSSVLVLLVLVSMLFDDQRSLLAMPVLINGALLFVFGSSLFGGRVPVVERFAKAVHGSLTPEHAAYCRTVTKVWCVFFVANGLTALYLALAAPLTVWALYTGGVAYVLMGVLFLIEYAVRKLKFG